MNFETFHSHYNKILDKSQDILVNKRKEYASNEDCLSNFRQAASLSRKLVPQTIAGMMIKHTISIYDMIDRQYGREIETYPLSTWEEKISDQINYLILLYASVAEGFSKEELSDE